jgi:hypothetical protein
MFAQGNIENPCFRRVIWAYSGHFTMEFQPIVHRKSSFPMNLRPFVMGNHFFQRARSFTLRNHVKFWKKRQGILKFSCWTLVAGMGTFVSNIGQVCYHLSPLQVGPHIEGGNNSPWSGKLRITFNGKLCVILYMIDFRKCHEFYFFEIWSDP